MENETKFAQPPYINDIEQIAIGEPITIYIANGEAPIATVNNYDDFPCADEEDLEKIDAEAQATAKLFCAAPDLLAALKIAQPHVCSLLCPSVKKTGEPWLHSDECKQISAAINTALTGAGEEANTNA